jgi:hypothetical protein
LLVCSVMNRVEFNRENHSLISCNCNLEEAGTT